LRCEIDKRRFLRCKVDGTGGETEFEGVERSFISRSCVIVNEIGRKLREFDNKNPNKWRRPNKKQRGHKLTESFFWSLNASLHAFLFLFFIFFVGVFLLLIFLFWQVFTF